MVLLLLETEQRIEFVVKRVGVGAMSGVVPLPATPLRGLRRPLLGQGEVRIRTWRDILNLSLGERPVAEVNVGFLDGAEFGCYVAAGGQGCGDEAAGGSD
jgi:hypothetical protein